jgi:hypothetical protein
VRNENERREREMGMHLKYGILSYPTLNDYIETREWLIQLRVPSSYDRR